MCHVIPTTSTHGLRTCLLNINIPQPSTHLRIDQHACLPDLSDRLRMRHVCESCEQRIVCLVEKERGCLDGETHAAVFGRHPVPVTPLEDRKPATFLSHTLTISRTLDPPPRIVVPILRTLKGLPPLLYTTSEQWDLDHIPIRGTRSLPP